MSDQRKLFGTDGVRGLANQWPMTPEIALQLGQAAALVFRGRHHRQKIIIGKDTRLSGYMIEQALASGICSMGGDVYLVGPLPTPGIAFLTESMRADAGVVISGSHNSFADNGIKFFSRDGFKLPDEVELHMERLIFENRLLEARPSGEAVGKAHRIDDAIGRYIVFLKNSFPREMSLEGLKVVVDCAHGAAYRVAPEVFEELGADVVAINTQPNGENINRDCGSLYPQGLQAKVREVGAHIGLALDGDADRVIFVDASGEIVDGDRILYTMATEMKRQGRLRKDTLVATVMSNMGLEVALSKAGIRLLRTSVGDRYVVDEMRRGAYNFGGESSGHLIFLDQNTTGDGMIAALQILAMMLRTGASLRDLTQALEIFPQHQISVRVKEKPDLMQLREVSGAIQRVEQFLKQEGRVLVRYSGTEPVARVMVEGRDGGRVQAYAEEIASALRAAIGA